MELLRDHDARSRAGGPECASSRTVVNTLVQAPSERRRIWRSSAPILRRQPASPWGWAWGANRSPVASRTSPPPGSYMGIRTSRCCASSASCFGRTSKPIREGARAVWCSASRETKTTAVIFEFGLLNPPNSPDGTPNPWVAQFHRLGELPFDESYNAALQKITDEFTASSAGQLDQLRSNENKLGNPWTLREWHLDKDRGALAVANVKNTPDDSFKVTPKSAALVAWVNANADTIKANAKMLAHGSFDLGLGTGPQGFLGLESSGRRRWVDVGGRQRTRKVRSVPARQACNGCRPGEPPNLGLGGSDDFPLFTCYSPAETNTDPAPARLSTLRGPGLERRRAPVRFRSQDRAPGPQDDSSRAVSASTKARRR